MEHPIEHFDTSLDDVVGSFSTTIEVKRELVEDLLTTALDAAYGGSNYWIGDYMAHYNGRDGRTGAAIGLDYYYECITRGGYIIFQPEDDDTNVTLDLERFIKGIKLWCDKFRGFGALCEDHDANDADNILQLALWGEVVYG